MSQGFCACCGIEIDLESCNSLDHSTHPEDVRGLKISPDCYRSYFHYASPLERREYDRIRVRRDPGFNETKWIETAAAALLVDLGKQGAQTTAPEGYEQPIEGCRRYAATLAGEVKQFLSDLDRGFAAFGGFRTEHEQIPLPTIPAPPKPAPLVGLQAAGFKLVE